MYYTNYTIDQLEIGMQVVIPHQDGFVPSLDFLKDNPVVTIVGWVDRKEIFDGTKRFLIEEDGRHYWWSAEYVKEIVCDATSFSAASSTDINSLFSN